MPLMHIADAIFKALGDWGSAMFPAFARAAAPAAVAALWQGAAVAVALVLCLRFAPRVSAAYRFALWATGFAVVVVLPLLPLLLYSGGASATASIRDVVAKPLMHPLMHLDIRWAFIIAAVWLAASAIRAGELAFHALRLRRLWKAATPVETAVGINSQVNLRVQDTLAAVSKVGRIEICTTRDLDCPSVIGFFAPRILIPEWLFSRLTPGELEQVVLHETEHLRRRDDWTNLLQKLSLVLFPLNPGLAWMERRLCREREMACDEGVVRRTHAPRAYAACLATLAERGLQQRELLRRAHALSLGAFTRRPELVHRVHSILRRRRALNPLAAGALVGVVGFGLVTGALELSRSPQLVAFVAMPEADAQVSALNPQSGTEGIRATDAVFHPTQHVDEIETRAIVTKANRFASRNNAMPSATVQPRPGDEPSAGKTDLATTNVNSAAPRAIQVKVAAPIPVKDANIGAKIDANSDAKQVREFVVLTTWEAVQTSSPNSRTVADYEISASDHEQTDHAGTQPDSRLTNKSQPDTNRDAQITITRMIMVFYPATAATGVQPAPKAGSPSHRPTTSYSGWLFFQL
jgi:beta-lactamase regulating signal transducer with metallopeptidase domain